MSGLTLKQEAFCLEYAIDRNGRAAAIRAGYAKGSARQQASRMLTKDNVKARIAEILSNSVKKAGVTLQEVMNELSNIGFSSMAGVATWDKSKVTLKPSSDLTPEQLKWIESVSETSGKDGSPQLRIRLHSKIRALEALVKVFELTEIEARLRVIEERLNAKGARQ